MKGTPRKDFIESFDVIVRLNKGYPVSNEDVEFLGSRTNIRYHSMATFDHDQGNYLLNNMISDVDWFCSQFPKNMDYFHNDILKFKSLNQEKINFHHWADLEQYLSYHHYMGTRMNCGTAAFLDLLNYNIKSLHISGLTYFKDGWVNNYPKQGVLEEGFLSGDVWGAHSMNPQIHLLKLIVENDSRVTIDNEMKEILKIK